jgi:hypothetical protein
VVARLEELGFKCVKMAQYQTDPATGKVYTKSSMIYRYDDPDSDTVHFVRIDEGGHMTDAQKGFAGGVGHYHVDSCDSSQQASPDRGTGAVPTDANGQPLSQDQNYQKQYEPGAMNYDDSHNPTPNPGPGGDRDAWAQKTHLFM